MKTRHHLASLSLLSFATMAAPAFADGPGAYTIASGPGQQTLGLQVEPGGVRAVVCAAAPCSATGAGLLTASEGAAPPFDRAKVETVILPGGRTIARVEVPGEEGARFVLLVAAPPAGDDAPRVIFRGWTGALHGEQGEEHSAEVVIERGPSGARVLVGERRADVSICGRPTLVGVREVDPATLGLTRAGTVQNLTEQERAKATRVTASRATDAPSGQAAQAGHGPLVLRATSASSAVGRRIAGLTDGDLTTTWAESKPGGGRGELVVMSAPDEVGIQALDVVIRPTPVTPAAPDPKAARAARDAKGPEGAAPKRFYLATNDALLEVTMPEDAWQRPPGTRYTVKLPAEVHTSCLAIVLEDAFAPSRPDARVTIAEVAARTAFDGATPEALAGALAGGAARAKEAAALLVRSGPPGIAAAIGAYEKLDDAGRELARGVVDAAPCADQAPFFAARIHAATSEIDRPKPAPNEVDPELAHARDRLRRCGHAAAGALADLVRKAGPRTKILAAEELAAIAPAEAIGAILDALTPGASGALLDDATRTDLRAALARATRSPKAAEATTRELAEDRLLTRPELVAIDLLRATGPSLGSLGAGAAFEKLAARSTSFRSRYLLQAPAAELARAGDGGARAYLERTLLKDEDAHVRRHAAEVAAKVPALGPSLVGAVDDADPRVREAAIGALAGSAAESTAAPVALAKLRERLDKDDWTFVRSSAARAMGAFPADAAIDRGLVDALKDPSPEVRVEIVDALAAHRAVAQLAAIRERQDDADEFTEVRAHAILALGAFCDGSSLASWTNLALGIRYAMEERERRLGGAAIGALGLIHPPDIAARLAPLMVPEAPPAVKEMARAAIAGTGSCKPTR